MVGNRRQLEIFASNCGEFARGVQKAYSWKPSVLVKAQKRWIKFICKSRSMQILVYSYTKIIARRFRTSWKQIRLRLVSISRKWHWCFYVLFCCQRFPHHLRSWLAPHLSLGSWLQAWVFSSDKTTHWPSQALFSQSWCGAGGSQLLPLNPPFFKPTDFLCL